MRNSIVLFSMIILIAFTSCKKDSGTKPLNDILLSGGTWTISNYRVDINPVENVDDTLAFEKDGKIKLQSNIKTGTGTWRTYDNGESIFLSIDVQNDDFIHLETSWEVLSMNSARLEFSSAGFFVTSYMTLSKN